MCGTFGLMSKWIYLRRQGRSLALRSGAWLSARFAAVVTSGAIGLFATFVVIGRHYFFNRVPIWLKRLSHPIYVATQTHPGFGRLVHVLFHAVPDVAFALLALAGLGYLMPGTVKSLETHKTKRLILIVFFFGFGLLAIIVNAVDREDQEHKDDVQGTRLGVVLSSVGRIEDKLSPKQTALTEAERRKTLAEVLRDEYVLETDPIDPAVLDGKADPPQEWMNSKLREKGETWKVTETIKRPPVQQIAPKTELATVQGEFYDDTANAPPKLDLTVAQEGLVVIAPVTFRAIENVPAKNGIVWLRICDECAWVVEPDGFTRNPKLARDRMLSFQTLLPNVLYPEIDMHIRVPIFVKASTISISFYYSCENCAPVDSTKPQVLSLHISNVKSPPTFYPLKWGPR